MARALFVFSVALLGAAAYGQRTVAVHVPPGDVVAFAVKGRPSAPPADPVAGKDGVATVTVDGKDTLVAWDRMENRVATAPVKGTDWSPEMDDFKDVAQVVLEVRSGPNPVAAANVTLDDGRGKRETLLEPSQAGNVTFFDVKPGSVKVTVRYKAGGQDQETTQLLTVKAEGGEAVPRFPVPLAGAVATIPAAGTTATPTASPSTPNAPTTQGSAPKDPGGSSSGVVGLLFALVIGGAVAAGAWVFLRKNPDAVGGTLERLGAQIPKPGDAPLADPPVAPAPAAAPPPPPQKIVLDAAPDPIQIPVPVAVSVAEPSLISEAGIPIPVIEGETVVGRDVGLGLSLAGETTVSRRHATVTRIGGTVTVQDAGSTNGTFVNGVPAAAPTTLRPGDSVQFGSVRFRYEG